MPDNNGLNETTAPPRYPEGFPATFPDEHRLEKPTQSTVMVTRKYPRFPVSLSSTLVHQNQFRHTGSIRDLSAKGCRVESLISPFTGMQIAIQLHIPGEPQPILIDNATVRWSGSAGIGVEFLTIAPPQQDRLSLMIKQLQPKAGLQ
ncbi:MAG: PilZ domain-containing protein [Nitrospirota bacterium]|nr:PilZ domain-containing protein [Nitrospirota bacterium]